MKKTFLLLLPIISSLSGLKAQCTGCTTTVNSISSSPYLVSTGQKLCITPSGTVTGLITVNGGTLCNQGTINNAKVWVYNGGYFLNQGTTHIDSLMIQDNSSVYDNYGIAEHVRYSTFLNATSNNYSTVTTDYILDSSAVVKNYGNLTVNFDLYSNGSSNFQNLSYLKINGSFYNANPSNFYTTCMIDVTQLWHNTGYIVGPGVSGCGGFNIGGFSYNSGTVGPSPTLKVDICDAGSPTSFDANSGNIANTTFCACANSCMLVTGINENPINSLSKAIFPNPCSQKCLAEYNENIRSAQLYNELGQKINSQLSIFENKVEIITENLKAGIYFIEVFSASGKADRQKLIVE